MQVRLIIEGQPALSGASCPACPEVIEGSEPALSIVEWVEGSAVEWVFYSLALEFTQ